MSEPVRVDDHATDVAWSDAATRRAELRRFAPTVVAAVIGVLATVAVPVLFIAGVTVGGWGLIAMVAAAGLAGGCFVSVGFGIAAHRAIRRTLGAHPWRQVEVMIGYAGVVTVTGPEREQDFAVDLAPGQHLGSVGQQRDLRVCGDAGLVVFGLEPGLRLRMARERVRAGGEDEDPR